MQVPFSYWIEGVKDVCVKEYASKSKINNLTPILFISLFIPIYFCERMYNLIKEYKILCEKSILVDVLTIGITGLILWLIFSIVKWVLEKFYTSFYNTFQEIKTFYVKKYREVYYPTPKNNSNIIEKAGLISYSQSISLIKQSVYGLKAKYEATKSGKLKETGGKYIKKLTFFGQLRANEYQEYTPLAEEKLELEKEKFLYDLIFKEYFGANEYLKDSIKINKDKLNKFLRTKELELQKEFFNS